MILGVSPESLSSRSLRYFGAEIDHLDFEDLWNFRQLSNCHRGPEQLEGDDHSDVLKVRTNTTLMVRV